MYVFSVYLRVYVVCKCIDLLAFSLIFQVIAEKKKEKLPEANKEVTRLH